MNNQEYSIYNWINRVAGFNPKEHDMMLRTADPEEWERRAQALQDYGPDYDYGMQQGPRD